MRLPLRIVCLLVALAGFTGCRKTSDLAPFMPRPGDFTLMWWANGPPYYLGMTSAPPAPVLCLQSGTLGLAIETKEVRLLHVGRFPQPLDATSARQKGDAAVAALPPMKLEIRVQRGIQQFLCAGRDEPSKDEFRFPVRFIESGRFFQRVAIEDLVFADTNGVRLEGKGRLELALWPDRLILTAELNATNQPSDRGELVIVAGQQQEAIALNTTQSVSLTLFGPTNAPPTFAADPELRAEWDAALGCQVVRLPDRPWKNSRGTYYPEEELDRLDRWPFTLRNDSGVEIVAPLMFELKNPRGMTGFTPLLCDAEGNPTGLPVQISKNWHSRPEKGRLPHQGPWFHGATFVHLPPGAHRDFVFSIAWARYGGLPAASHAQLCLVGWGHNQFWDEAALGSFGESICYEPGRVQRRCFIDDVRPFMTLPELDAKPYGWAANAGGGDFLMWIDEEGRYQGFRGTRTEYRAYGPCLTDVSYCEETLGGEITARMETSIARSDDYLRVFHRLRYNVHRPVKWQRLAFYQLGADFYNGTPARRVAMGNAAGLGDEWTPPRTNQVYDRRGVPLTGAQPWVSIHGVERSEVKRGNAAAGRGLIVRSWKAVLEGRPVTMPHLSTFATEWGRGNFRTVVELSPPPDINELRPGDFVEADVEMVVFPADAAAYYGPNEAFRQALARDADTWRLVQREAAGNAFTVRATKGDLVRPWPMRVQVDGRQRATCEVSGGLGSVPVTFTGVQDHRDFELWVNGKPFDQSVHGNDFWQTDYDEEKKTWSVTYNFPADPEQKATLEFRPCRVVTRSSR